VCMSTYENNGVVVVVGAILRRRAGRIRSEVNGISIDLTQVTKDTCISYKNGLMNKKKRRNVQ